MINWFDMPAEGLSNGGLFEVKELEVTENGTYETKGEMYNKVTVNVEGGGGSSDFSTAEVTITNNSSEEVQFYIPTYMDIPGYGTIIQSFMWTNSEEPTFEGEVVIPTNGELYVGSSLAQFTTSNTSITGNARLENGQLIITGDCTITIS